MRPSARGVVIARVADEVRPYARWILRLSVIAVAWAVWVSGPGWVTPAFALAAAGGASLGVIDARTQRLPNVIVYPAFAAVAAFLVLAAAATGEWGSLGRAGLGGAALGGVYLVIHLIDPQGRSLGLGDVKLAAILGTLAGWMSWTTVIWTGALPFLVGAVAAIALLVRGRGGRGTMIAFGPFMLIGAVVALTWARAHGGS